MSFGNYNVPLPVNEPIFEYRPGCPERAKLKAEIKRQREEVVQIPLIIGGKEIFTEKKIKVVMPHKHSHVLAECSVAGEKELKDAVEASMAAKAAWEDMPWEHRAAIFLKAAELASTKYRAKLNAATMNNQSKVAYQAEIDSACELIDFLRFNVYFADQIYREQPENMKGVWNRLVHRPLEGFVLAVSPFNFTAIGLNLVASPAMVGNTVVWKPATTAVLSNYYVMQLLMEAGLPAGVINFVPSSGADVSRVVVSDIRLAGFHFTGSTDVFSDVWKHVGNHLKDYISYPRLVGETGGKNYVFAHASADVPAVCCALVRGAYEYQGQKCSAASRAYIPESMWSTLKPMLLSEISKLKVGDVADFTNFMSAVIDKKSFNTIKSAIDNANAAPDAEVLCGGYDDTEGYFIEPTVILTDNKEYETMHTELFGPVLTVFVYPDNEFEKTLTECATASKYALTGAIFSQDREVLVSMEKVLMNSAGNFYINDKPTGAMVGQQPFGGARGSGTNDKAGSPLNLYRWISLKTVKESFVPPHDVNYPFMLEE